MLRMADKMPSTGPVVVYDTEEFYLAGVLAFWGALTAMRSDSEGSKLGYCAINLGLKAVQA